MFLTMHHTSSLAGPLNFTNAIMYQEAPHNYAGVWGKAILIASLI